MTEEQFAEMMVRICREEKAKGGCQEDHARRVFTRLGIPNADIEYNLTEMRREEQTEAT